MALTTRHKLNKSLQSAFPRGTPFDHQELTKLGVSSALAHHYLKSGWLARLGRGVFMFPNDTLRRDDCLKFLSRRVKGFHVGGKTALAWRGVRHNLPAREPLSLWGEGKTRFPKWFQKLFPARYTTRNPFSAKLPKNFGLQPLPETPDGVLVSVPERALLEMLSEVGHPRQFFHPHRVGRGDGVPGINAVVGVLAAIPTTAVARRGRARGV